MHYYLALPAFASSDPASDETAPSSNSGSADEDVESSLTLEDVIVYTRKRDEPSQSVPIALDVLGSESIFERGIYNLEDVTRQSPSVYLKQGSVPQDLSLSIRGITPTRGRPNMAILVDGVDITTEAMITSGGSLLIDPMLLDIEQIEIVKGPQNALYGRSAFAGAINYKTRAPGNEFRSMLETDLGDYGQRMIRGRMSGPIVNNTLSAGLSVANWNHDGFYDSPITGGELGGRSGSSFAGTLRWTPGGGWRVQARVSYEDSELDVQPQVHPEPNAVFTMPTSALGPVVDPGVTTIRGIRGNPPAWDESQIGNSSNPRTPGVDYPGSDKEVLRATLNVTREFGDAQGLGPAKFVSLTHVASAETLQFQDFNAYGDASALPAFGEIWIDNDVELFSQNFRLQSGDDAPLTWTIGAEYWEEQRDVLNGGVTCLTYAPPFVPAEGRAGLWAHCCARGHDATAQLGSVDTRCRTLVGLRGTQLEHQRPMECVPGRPLRQRRLVDWRSGSGQLHRLAAAVPRRCGLPGACGPEDGNGERQLFHAEGECSVRP